MRRKDKQRLVKVDYIRARSSLLELLELDGSCEYAQIIKEARKKLQVRKKRSSESDREYLHVIGAGVALGDVKLKAANKKSFYQSWEWKKVRYDAIKLYEQRCMCCGWQVGDTESGFLVVDHIKPRSKYPMLALDINNLQILCNDCNMGKSNHVDDDWRSVDERFKATILNG